MSDTDGVVMLDVKGLKKSFGNVHAVKDLTFQVKKGEIFGFLGPNGAGKTTTMRMITSFMPSSEGSVKIDGLNVSENTMAIREKIGYLPESAPLYTDMKVSEYIEYVGKLRDLHGSKLEKAADNVYEICGLKKMLNRKIGNLSKGYRQRVGLAQALIHEPELLILDEPMSGLDPNQIVEIRELIKKIGKEKTVIYCSHILSEVSATCDNILIINNGELVAKGTPKELTAKTLQNNTYNITFKGEIEIVQKKYLEIEGVEEAKLIGESEGSSTLQITTNSGNDIGEALFKCAVENGITLSELKREEKNLENVFTKLTRGK